MIEQTSFLGMPLRTRRQRRRLVILYYVVLAAFFGAALKASQRSWAPLVAQTLTLGGLMGGIRFGGPVKPYADIPLPLAAPDGTMSLNLEGRKPFDTMLPGFFQALDEREREERNAAHYRAYSVLRWTLGLGLIAYWALLAWFPEWTERSRLQWRGCC